MTNQTEHDEQVAFLAWTRTRPELALVHAIPNGGHRDRRTAQRLKAEGVRAGIPDLFVPVMRGGHGGLYIEMKSMIGTPSPEQMRVMSALHAAGYCAVVVRGWRNAAAVTEAYLKGGRVYEMSEVYASPASWGDADDDIGASAISG